MVDPRRERANRWRGAVGAATAAVVAVAALGLPAQATERIAAEALSPYGGLADVTLEATGFFRTAQVDGRWWLVDPDGHPFFSNGVNHVVPEGTPDRNGHAAYHDAILAKHGSEGAWADAQVERFGAWGVNTLGGWSDHELFAGRGVPYTVMLGFAGYGGGRVADFWDPGWVDHVAADAAGLATRFGGDPWLVGYFLDNEVPWTDDWRKGPFTGFFGRGAAEPGKAHLVDWLRDRYDDDFAAFAADFDTAATGWDGLGAATSAAPVGAGAQATKDAWSGEVARRFFSVTGDALQAADPDHLNLGVRFVGQLITPEVLEAADGHVDVVSVNWYEIKDEWKAFLPTLGYDFLSTDGTLAAHRALVDLPFLLSEFGWRARDSGLPNTYPPLQVVVDTQRQRADSYRNFGACLVNTGDVVGAHWFEMTDEPAIGRFDGEDDNWGMVTEADEVYELVVEAAADVHDTAYAPLADPDRPPEPCTPISDRVAGEEAVVDVVTSTEDGSARVALERRTVTPGSGTGPHVQVDLAAARQRIHGVGAALTESSAYLLSQLPDDDRRALLRELFDPERGGLSVLRLPIGASDFVLETHSLAESPVPDPELTTFTIERDRRWVLPVLREILAFNPDLELVASPWSAPGWMKNTGSFLNGVLLEQFEGVYADYLVRFVEAYRAEGIAIDWLTVQNEPAAILLDSPSMVMSAEQQARLVRDDLGPALVRAGLGTRVLAWDHNWCDARATATPPGSCVGSEPTAFPLEVLEGTGGGHPLGGTAFHCYGGDQAAANEQVHAARPGLQIWLTECSGGEWQDDPFGDLARLLITDRNHWSNATLLWNLALDPANGPTTGCATCRGVVTVDPAAGTWAPELERDLLVTVGWFGGRDAGVLTTTATGDVLATGVCGADRRPAAIVWNPSGAATTATVAFDDLALPIELPARSVTAVRAPEGTRCELADWPALPEPAPTTSTTTTTEVPAPAPAPAAAPIAGNPTFTG